jgi:hypothetical protein
MKKVSKEAEMIALNELKKLAEVEGPCLSIFQPVRDKFAHATATDAGLLAAEHLADRLLREKGLDEASRKRFLRPIARIAKKTSWPGRTGGVVIFRAPGFMRASFWSAHTAPQVKLGDEFFVLPLLAGFHARTNFWVLALSTKRTRLLRGTAQRLIEVDLPEHVAHGLVEFGGFDRPDHDLENRSSCGPSHGQMTAVRSGTSSFRETKDRYLHDFFKLIDRAVHPIVSKSHDPLVLAGVPRELAAYREINSYPGLLEEAVHGSPDAISEEHLHGNALQLVQERSAQRSRQVRRYTEAVAGQGLLAIHFDEIADAARAGRIDHLYVTELLQESDEAVNRTVLEVLRHAGQVEFIESSGLGSGVAATLRYRLAQPPTLVAEHRA